MVDIKNMSFEKEGIREDLILARAIEDEMIPNVSSDVAKMKTVGDSISFAIENTRIWSIGNRHKGIIECQIADIVDGSFTNHRGKNREYTWNEAINVVLEEKGLPKLEFTSEEYLEKILSADKKKIKSSLNEENSADNPATVKQGGR